jgi:hypothetical protein
MTSLNKIIYICNINHRNEWENTSKQRGGKIIDITIKRASVRVQRSEKINSDQLAMNN